MMRNFKSRSIVAALVVTGVSVAACGKKKEDSDASVPSSLADLKLSSALKITIPDGMTKAGGGTKPTTLHLSGSKLAGKKSSEACRAMSKTTEIFTQLAQAGSSLCHIEVESDKMKFGTKYQVNAAGANLETMSLQIWVDNSDSANLKVYTCHNGTLAEQFNITGFAGAGKAKGSMFQKYEGSEQGMNYSGGVNMDFDMTQSGVSLVQAKMKHDMSGTVTGSYRNYSDIKIVDAGVSALLMSSEGPFGNQSFSEQGAMNHNGTFGQSLYSGTFNDGTQNYPQFTTRSTFNAEGLTVDASQAPDEVKIDKSKLPAKLAADFAPTAPSGWDCTGTTETIAVDLMDATKAAEHAKCEVEWPQYNCDGTDFDFGTPE